MSSSIFFESSAVGPETEPLVSCFEGGGGAAGDSNLVVVYGKNGINFDRKGLESLIEEKALSSISVIRLTSPTLSMEAEEEEDQLKESDSNEDSGNDGEFGSGSEREEDDLSDLSAADSTSQENEDESDNENDSAGETKGSNRRGRKKRINSKNVKPKRRQRPTERPEVVGLTVEEFYSAEYANEVLKQALRKAGISTIKHTEEYEFQLYVIKNDHCYTPFTSPEQMKAKLALGKVDADNKMVGNQKKNLHHSGLPHAKQPVFIKKKQKPAEIVAKVQSDKRDLKHVKVLKQKEQDDFIIDDEDIHSSMDEIEEDEDEDSEEFETEESVETDNDRDSDLDFNINNRKGQKRKIKLLKKTKRAMIKNQQAKRVKHGLNDADDIVHTPQRLFKAIAERIPNNDTGSDRSLHTVKTVLPSVNKSSAPDISIVQRPPQIIKSTVSVFAKRQTETNSISVTPIRRGPVVQVGSADTKPKFQSSPQNIKEIVINKMVVSPKGGFTDIGDLLGKNTIATTSGISQGYTTIRKLPVVANMAKGFTPLAIESAVKNQLPVQISIQTHQSSSEMAAEHDKQLDLIDSIVKNELQKSSGPVEQNSSTNDNIPELVKMLESTERALESKQLPLVPVQANSFDDNAAPVNEDDDNDIDIGHTPLLETPVDDIPDDFLQHVVKLIEDDKSLQEAVEKEVFGGDDSCEDASPPSPPLEPIFQKSIQPGNDEHDDSAQSKDIQASTYAQFDSIHTPKTAPMLRKEPIQIVRGNGRVITLPPIEAPTTRAKRRAQAIPGQSPQQNATFSALNESSLDSSLHSNSSFTTTTENSNIADRQTRSSERPTVAKRRISKEGSTTNVSAKQIKRGSGKRASTSSKGTKADDELETANESHGDDDDPNKLWCICRQPHNNRFMICCDSCEDWFHGTCVNITKAMGLEMEQKSIDWTCPKCLKQQEEKKQRKITDMLVVKPKPTAPATTIKPPDLETINVTEHTTADSSTPMEGIAQQQQQLQLSKKPIIEIKKISPGSYISLKQLEQHNTNKKSPTTLVTVQRKLPTVVAGVAAKQVPSSNVNITSTPVTNHQIRRVVVLNKATLQQHQQQQQQLHNLQTNKTTVITTTACIVCRKRARPNSIYCSDDCIRKHAHNSLQYFMTKSPEPNTVTVGSSTSSNSVSGVNKTIIKIVPDDNKKLKKKGLFEDVLSMADRKLKAERVHVFERKTGRVLTGASAPTTHNLKKWLQENPTFEVVQPGSIQAIEIEKRQKQRLALQVEGAGPLNRANTFNSDGSNSPQALTNTTTVMLTKSFKQFVDQAKTSPRSVTPKPSLQKYPQQVTIKPDKPMRLTGENRDDNTAKLKDRDKLSKTGAGTSGTSSVTKKAESSSDSEPIRLNVRRTLKEQLLARMNEPHSSDVDGSVPLTNATLTPDEVEKFTFSTESEMYHLFGRDTGAKYKAKYRSLMFNIKDRKNQTLFAKICAKHITPKELVRMSPEELASQELAQWREKEAKHQLEMITKSELDLLSCAKHYVLKTHKGEEVDLDLSAPELADGVEDVASVLNSSANAAAAVSSASVLSDDALEESSGSRKDSLNTSEHSQSSVVHDSSSTKASSSSKDQHSRKSERGREHVHSRSHDRERERDRHHKSKERDRHRDKSRSRSGKHSHSRSRSRSRDRDKEREKRHKSSTHKDTHYNSNSKEESSKAKFDKRDAQYTKEEKLNAASKQSSFSILQKESPTTPKPLEAYSLIDQILESTKTVEEAANLINDREPPSTSTSSNTQAQYEFPSAAAVQQTQPQPVALHVARGTTSAATIAPTSISPIEDGGNKEAPQASSHTMNLYTRYINGTQFWSGSINMIDVASFKIALQSVLGNTTNMSKLLPSELDVVGRIPTNTVWDYISKIKRSPNKEIVVVRLIPASESETIAYDTLYQYLDKRQRLGVIKTAHPQTKDFYIYPLGMGKQIPIVLQELPSERLNFFEDEQRPNMLIGIVIRVTGKRPAGASVTKVVRTSADYTAPGSPKRKKITLTANISNHSRTQDDEEIDIIDAIIKAPIAAKTLHKPASTSITPSTTTTPLMDDGNEPYSPGGSSDEGQHELPLIPLPPATTTSATADDDLKRKMEDLNRKIAAREMEIAGLLKSEPTRFASASPTVLANISIPSNLSQILASIKSKPAEVVPVPVPAPRLNTATSPPPPPPPLIGSLIGGANSTQPSDVEEYNPEDALTYEPRATTGSRLAQLSEAELLKMVPDNIMEQISGSSNSSSSRARFEEYDSPSPRI